MDTRVSWLSKTVCRGLNATRADFEDCFSRDRKRILAFLDEKASGGSLLFYTASSSQSRVDGDGEKVGEEEKPKNAEDDDVDDDDDVKAEEPSRNKGGLQILVAVNHIPDRLGSHAAMFALKTVEGSVKVPASDAAADEQMLESVEFGIMPGHALVMLERVIKDVYMPMADPELVQNGTANMILATAEGQNLSASGTLQPQVCLAFPAQAQHMTIPRT